MEPLLAVIITSYNYEKFIANAIDSVLCQLNDQVELIIVDDGSKDNSWEIIKSYNIEKSFLLENGGQAKACLFGIQQSKASFFLFLDSDDALAPGALSEILKYLDPKIAKIQFSLIPIDAEGTVIGPPTPTLANYRRRQELINEITNTGTYTSPPTSGNVFCRELCEIVEEVNYEISIDGVTLIAAPLYGDVVSISKPLGYYRIHGGGYSGQGTKLTVGRIRNDCKRFTNRLNHLFEIARRKNIPITPPVENNIFYLCERKAFESIVSGRGLSFSALPRLIRSLWRLGKSSGHKAAMTIFFFLCCILPAQRAIRLLDYRMRPGHRSIYGSLRHAFGSR